jgi:4-amino-4-deoxy-L-arabinose transferase-like glycosyltransferase
MAIFVVGTMSVWYTAFHLGRRPEAQPLRLAFGGQPEPNDYGRTLADTAALIYLGCLGLLLFSHETLAVTLQGTLVAYFLYRAVRYVETPSLRNAALIGLSLGLLTLARGWHTPVTLVLALLMCSRFLDLPLPRTLGHLGLASLTALGIATIWIAPALSAAGAASVNPVAGWMAWSASQLGLPTWASIKTFLRVGIWFFWPAWPFAGWAIYAWRRQDNLLHIVLPLTFVAVLTVLIVCDPFPQNGDLLKLLPPLAIMAAFGMPTMKRGTINAIDWFSVMVLTMLAGLLWMFWAAKLTGVPAQFARNLLKLLPGFAPQFSAAPFVVAACASIGWIALVQWRISRQPAVLWRAVVLSSGGLILLWVLLMTLFLPDLNYSKSYQTVARQLAAQLPAGSGCVDAHLGLPQRASFAYYGAVPFAPVDEKMTCRLLLVQDSVKLRDDNERAPPHDPAQWQQIWEGRRASDRDERFKLYQRR